MKPKEIQELIDFIAQSGLDEVNIETENFKLSVKKNTPPVKGTLEGGATTQPIIVPVSQPVTLPVNTTPTVQSVAQSVTKPASSSDDSRYITVKSPMIGTYYKSANPESPAFVNIGDTISPGQTLCIIEAMKLFNEIESEVSGKVVKFLVENASPVEYDQPLFLIDPS